MHSMNYVECASPVLSSTLSTLKPRSMANFLPAASRSYTNLSLAVDSRQFLWNCLASSLLIGPIFNETLYVGTLGSAAGKRGSYLVPLRLGASLPTHCLIIGGPVKLSDRKSRQKCRCPGSFRRRFLALRLEPEPLLSLPLLSPIGGLTPIDSLGSSSNDLLGPSEDAIRLLTLLLSVAPSSPGSIWLGLSTCVPNLLPH